MTEYTFRLNGMDAAAFERLLEKGVHKDIDHLVSNMLAIYWMFTLYPGKLVKGILDNRADELLEDEDA